MLRVFSPIWWVTAVRGFVLLLVGLVILAWPDLTLDLLLALFAAIVLLDGGFSTYEAFGRSQRGEQWWPRLLRGLVGIGAGLVTILWPAVTATVLLYIVAFWALITGVLEIVAAVQYRRVLAHNWLLVVVGTLSVLVGLLLIANPMAGALALATLIGAYFLILGILLLILALVLRGAAVQ